MHAFSWKNGFQRLHQKRILFYHAKGSHARSHHTHARSHHAHAQSHTSLSLHIAYFFVPVPSDSRSTALQVMASTLNRAQLLGYTRAGVRRYSKSATDTCTYMCCTCIKFNCNMRVVRTYVKRNGPCTVSSASVRGPFNIRSKSVQ